MIVQIALTCSVLALLTLSRTSLALPLGLGNIGEVTGLLDVKNLVSKLSKPDLSTILEENKPLESVNGILQNAQTLGNKLTNLENLTQQVKKLQKRALHNPSTKKGNDDNVKDGGNDSYTNRHKILTSIFGGFPIILG